MLELEFTIDQSGDAASAWQMTLVPMVVSQYVLVLRMGL